MAFKGVTFAGQNVTPKDDGALYQAHYGDGILDGCSMAISGDDLVIQSGHFIAGGRVCHVDGATNVDLSGRTLQTRYIQVIMNYDMSQGEGSQWYPTFVESATTTFPALTTDDINGTGTLYQIQLAVVQVSGGNLTSINWQRGMSQVRVYSVDRSNRWQMTALGDYASIQGGQDGGNMVGGIFVDQTGQMPVTGLYSIDGRIAFRPKGQSDNTGWVYLTDDGQVHGGALVQYETNAGSISLPAGTWVDVAHISVGAGVFICTGSCLVKGVGTSSTARAYGGIGVGQGGDDSSRTNSTMNMATQYSFRVSSHGIVQTTGSSNIAFWVNAETATTATARNLKVVQIA